jgi:hypothetical protein
MSVQTARRLVPLLDVPNQPGYAWAKTRWLRRQAYERRLAYHKVAGRVLINLDDLDDLIASGRVEPD